MADVTYESKIDAWLLVVLIATAALCLYAVGRAFSPSSPAGWTFAVVTLVVGLALPLWCALTTRYTLTDSDLIVRTGPLTWKIALAEIHNIVPTRNVLSSPAMSLDRLRIDYGRMNSIMISPRDKEGFLRDLRKRQSALTHQTSGAAQAI